MSILLFVFALMFQGPQDDDKGPACNNVRLGGVLVEAGGQVGTEAWAAQGTAGTEEGGMTDLQRILLRLVVAVHDNWRDDPSTSDLDAEQKVFVRLPLGVLRQVWWLRKELEKAE